MQVVIITFRLFYLRERAPVPVQWEDGLLGENKISYPCLRVIVQHFSCITDNLRRYPCIVVSLSVSQEKKSALGV
jgi:hypothetical protein